MMTTQTKKTSKSFFDQVREIVFILLVVFLIRTLVFGLYQVPTGSMEPTMLVGERFFAEKFTYLFSKPKRGHIISLNSPLYEYSDNKLKRWFEEYVWGPVNLTKRVIGVPGDTLVGKIEDGKPVIYLNGARLEEPYLNQFPLITVWKSKPSELHRKINEEAISLLSQNQLSPAQFEQFMQSKYSQNFIKKTYDPSKPYDKQPFYRIEASHIAKDQNGYPFIDTPGSIITEPRDGNEPPMDKNYWDGSDVFHVVLGPNEYWLMGDNRLNSGDSRMFGPVDGRLIHGQILFRIWSMDSYEDWWIFDLIKNPIDFWSRIRWNRFLQMVQ